MKKKLLALVLVVVLALTSVIGGTMAYLTDTDDAVNVMTLGNVSITQNEQQRVEENGEFSKKLEEFEQGKKLMPVTYPGNRTADEVTIGDYTLTLSDDEANYVDKIISVTNTGSEDAYVRTLVAVPTGGDDWEPDPVQASDCWLHWNIPAAYDQYWTLNGTPTLATIGGVSYYVWEFTHNKAVASKETTFPMVRGFYMDKRVDNDDEGFFMIDNGTTKRINAKEQIQILALTQAVQEAGFANAQSALDEAFGNVTKENAEKWFSGIMNITVTPTNIDTIDFTQENQTFMFTGDFEDVSISEIGEGSVLAFNGATVKTLALTDDAVITGKATLEELKAERNGADPIELTVTEATLDVTGGLRAANTDGKSTLNIKNSTVDAGTVFIGGHTNNAPEASAEFNVINSYLSCEENSLGSTISVWGRSGVDAKIHDSEIHTYSRGWHQSEDANDNSITFQGADHINVDIQRSNMHLYGARSIINARPYGGNPAINFTINESLLWVVTKSTHGEETLPVWNYTSINNSALIFTKGVHASNPVAIKTDVFGNPVIHGNYAVTTQCSWATDIALADGQTVTIAKNANVSIYEGAAEVNFVLTGSAKVVVEAGASMTNIGVKAAEGYTLNTDTSNGSTIYSVAAN